MPNEQLYIDEPVVASFSISELGWLIQRWQGYLRYLKVEKYPDHKFVIMMNQDFHILVNDFIYCTIDLPQEFYNLKLETDCYEAPLAGSPPGSLTPPDVYSSLIEYFRNFYNVEKAIEIWPPRGCNPFWIDHNLQIFAKYAIDKNSAPRHLLRPIVCVCPRGRTRAPHRNVPEYVWKELVDKLKEEFTVVLCGTPSGSCLADYKDDTDLPKDWSYSEWYRSFEETNVINLISYEGKDKFDKVVEYMCRSLVVISSQSGLTHLGLMCNKPSYIIGHEKERHAVKENRLNAPVSFRYVTDYRLIDAQTILRDLSLFFEELVVAGY